jgi:hypothetical protein
VSVPFAYIGFYVLVLTALALCGLGVAVGRRVRRVGLEGWAFVAGAAGLGALLAGEARWVPLTAATFGGLALFSVLIGSLSRR